METFILVAQTRIIIESVTYEMRNNCSIINSMLLVELNVGTVTQLCDASVDSLNYSLRSTFM